MKFYFCEGCGRRITDQDLQAGAGKNKKLKGVYCGRCEVGVMTMENLPLTRESAGQILQGSPGSAARAKDTPRGTPARRSRNNTTRLQTPPEVRLEGARARLAPASNHGEKRAHSLPSAVLLLGIGGLAILVPLFLQLGMGRPGAGPIQPPSALAPPGPELAAADLPTPQPGCLESRSRRGNINGSILEGRVVVTFDGRRAAEDWYEVTFSQPATIRRVVYVHGRTFHDGGWFDTTAGSPRVQVRTQEGGEWQPAGEFTAYPATTAIHPAGLGGGERFMCELPKPMRAVAIRVVGTPACGDNPRQAFSSCGGLQAFTR